MLLSAILACAPEETIGDVVPEPVQPSADPIDDDADGTPAETDCDDGDPTVHPGAVERLDDGLDSDCDGADAPGFAEWRTSTGGRVQGPRFAGDAQGVLGVGLLLSPEEGPAELDWIEFDGEARRGASTRTAFEGWTVGTGFDLALQGSTIAAAATVYDEGYTRLSLFQLANETWAWTGYGWSEDSLPDWDALDLHDDGVTFTLVACAQVGGWSPVLYLRGTASQFSARDYVTAMAPDGFGASRCAVSGPDVALAASTRLELLRDVSRDELAPVESLDLRAHDVVWEEGTRVVLTRDAIWVDDTGIEVATEPVEARVSRAPDGRVFVYWRGEQGDPELVFGDERIALTTGLGEIEGLDVDAGTDGAVRLAVFGSGSLRVAAFSPE